MNAPAGFARAAIAGINAHTGLEFREAEDHFEAQGARDALVESHGQLNTIATSLFKIASDIRLMGSGPRCALGELLLPATQPGSSIMPGKVNPVLCESLTQVAARVFGNQSTVTWCGANGHLELNTFQPLLAETFLESVHLLAAAVRAFEEKCAGGLEANADRCREWIEQSLSLATALAPAIGYDQAATLAKESLASGRTVRDLATDRAGDLGLDPGQLDDLLDPARMAGGLGG